MFWVGVAVVAVCVAELGLVAWLQWHVFHDKEK